MAKKTSGTSGTSKTTNGKAPRARRTKTSRSPERTEEAIRIRAYELYLARDGSPGSPQDDWLQAEREIAAEAVITVPRTTRKRASQPST